jgi:hypothetical protein
VTDQGDQASANSRRLWLASVGGVLSGAIYAGVLYLLARLPWFPSGFVSASGIFGTPLVIGAICVGLSTPAQQASVSYRCMAPWLSIALVYVLFALIKLETLICLIMLAPVTMGLATLGGAIAGKIIHGLRQRKAAQRSVLGCVVLLPLLCSQWEAHWQIPSVTHTVNDRIVIDASPTQVWDGLLNVPDIRRQELSWSFSHAIGLPRPLAAKLSGTGEGAVRDLYWEGGIHFREYVTAWEPVRRLTYRVDVSPARDALRRLDTHVVIGDRYFDIEDGEYRLRDLGDGRTELSLSTTYRMRTMVNPYGEWWANRTLDDFHTVVLRLLKQRVEHRSDHVTPV